MADLTERMKKAGEDFSDPALDAVRELGDSFTASVKMIEERQEGTDEKIEKLRKAQMHEDEKLRTEVLSGMKDLADRVEFLGKRQSIVYGSVGNSVEDKLIHGIDEKQRGLISKMRPYAVTQPANSHLSSPVVAAATERWFKLATKLQMRHFYSEHPRLLKEFEALNEAFVDALSVTKAPGTGLQEDSLTEGGRTVPTLVADEVLRQALDSSVVAGGARQMPMGSNVVNIPSEATGCSVAFVAEEGTIGNNEPTFGQVQLTAKKLVARATASIELIEDSAIAVLPYLQSIFAERMGRQLDLELMEGDGTNFTGVNSASGVNSVAMTTGTAAVALTYAKLVDTFVAAGEQSARADGVWVMNAVMFGKVIGLVDSNGQPIVRLMAVETAPAMSLFGRPIRVTNAMQAFTVATAGDSSNIYFGPLRSLILGTRTGMRWDVSDAPNWQYYQMDMRLVGRIACVVGVAKDWVKLTKVLRT